jgi:hypothetical protein
MILIRNPGLRTGNNIAGTLKKTKASEKKKRGKWMGNKAIIAIKQKNQKTATSDIFPGPCRVYK